MVEVEEDEENGYDARAKYFNESIQICLLRI
jgi:hypothetical protein